MITENLIQGIEISVIPVATMITTTARQACHAHHLTQEQNARTRAAKNDLNPEEKIVRGKRKVTVQRDRTLVRNTCNSEGRYLIQVKDKSTGPLNRENGPSYPISLNPRTSCDRIASFLAPDKRHAKVIVHWDDGRMENLGKQIPMDELIQYAEYLEVKEVKRVHWAA
ncbi:hypothetical protein FAVG1_10379 [Fusarium avenaceum]|nr:hypothetical protein FAVG1_10379 [Fusarium avenaceum]